MKPTPGKTQLVNPTAGKSGGFHCDTCNATFTAYDAYLDHCNSRLHQRNLGTTTEVERVDDVERIRARLAILKERKLKRSAATPEEAVRGVQERIAQRKLEEEERRRQKYQDRKKKNDIPAEEPSEEEKLMSSVLGISAFK